jgi:hypothetical protein
MNKVISFTLRGIDQALSTVMQDLVWGKKARRGSRMSRSVLRATAAPKAPRTRRVRYTRPTTVVVHVYAGAHVNMPTNN